MRMFVLLILPLVRATGLDTSVCTPLPKPTTAQPMRPVIPKSFEVHVDCVIINKNMTTEVHEHYDDVGNRGVAEQHAYGEDFKAYYDYTHNEFMGVYPNTGQCSVSNLSTSDQRFLFGYTPGSGGHGHIYTPSGALHFGTNETEVYIGLHQVRGIWCQGWKSCQYWAGMKASMNVTWYFADPNSWDSALNIPQIPVRCHVIGRVQDTAAKSHDFEHYYEFIHFRDFIENPKVFEIDDDVVCPGRINTKPLPNVVDALTLMVEQVDEVQKMVTFTSEWFDSRMKLTRFDMRPSALSASKFGTNRLTIIRDFNSGIQYVKDQLLGNCTVSALSQDNWDDRMQDPQHVRIATAQEFFHFDNTYSYTGIKSVRGVDCDTWISLRTDFPPGLPVNSTWEWAFVAKNWSSGYDPIAYAQSAIPFRLSVKADELGIEYSMNMFQYDAQEPQVMEFDITNCMNSERRHTFRLAFPQTYTSLISSNIPKFRYASVIAIMAAASVSPLRISNLRVNVYNNTAYLNFDLVDKPPVKGDVIDDNVGLPLTVAASEFVKSVHSGSFQIIVTINNNIIVNIDKNVCTRESEFPLSCGGVSSVTWPEEEGEEMTYISPIIKSLAENDVTAPPTTRPPVTPRPTINAPVTNKPATQKPVTNKPRTQKPVTNKPRTQKPFTQRPVTQRPRTQAPFTRHPNTQAPPTHRQFTLAPKTNPTPWNPFPGSTSLNLLCGPGGSTGYKAGVMAGVAVVMVVFGGVCGGGLAIFLSRRRRI